MPTLVMNDCPPEAAPPQPANRRPGRARVAMFLYALTGLTGLLAEQGFEKYIALLVGATASASAVVLFTYFLGFRVGRCRSGAAHQRKADGLRARCWCTGSSNW
jgi:hypothetical protein